MGQDVVDNAFVLAAQNGHRECAGWLLGRGARVNAKPPGFHWGGTALHAAVWHGDVAMVDWLLEQGADPTVRDTMVRADAVGWARHHGHLDVLAVLESR